MKSRLKEIEKLSYKDEVYVHLFPWEDKLNLYFDPNFVEDITNPDTSTCYTFYISLGNEGLFSDSIDEQLTKEDVYFIEIQISKVKPLITITFLKYLQNRKGHELDVSEKPYLSKHKKYHEIALKFAKDYELEILNNKDLKIKMEEDGETVDLYYGYFSQYP